MPPSSWTDSILGRRRPRLADGSSGRGRDQVSAISTFETDYLSSVTHFAAITSPGLSARGRSSFSACSPHGATAAPLEPAHRQPSTPARLSFVIMLPRSPPARRTNQRPFARFSLQQQEQHDHRRHGLNAVPQTDSVNSPIAGLAWCGSLAGLVPWQFPPYCTSR
jgi:hypothetical protein